MSHWCFTCGKYPPEDTYEIVCKEKQHDIDFEDDFKPISEHNEKKKSESQVKKLLKFVTPLIKKLVISTTDSSGVYGLVSVDNHYETIEIGSIQSISWLKAKYFESYQEVLSEETYKSTLDLIKARAPFLKQVKKEPIYKRCSLVGDSIYYDLCTKDWKIVKISKDEISIIQHNVNTPIL